MKIGVFGSAFNPPHMGHLSVIRQAMKHFDLILVAPSYRHAFGKVMPDFADRERMIKALFKHLPTDGAAVEFTDVERRIARLKGRAEPIYTFDLLSEVEKDNPDAAISFIVGPDNAANETWSRFYNGAEILKRWEVFVAKELLPIRSSDIRSILNANGEILEHLCPVEIQDIYKSIDTKGTAA